MAWDAQVNQSNKFSNFCNIIRKELVMNCLFCMQISMEVFYKLIQWFLMGRVKHSQSSQKSKFAISLQYFKHEVRDEVDFFHADKHQSFLQVGFNKVILSSLMGMVKHSQSTQSNKCAISLQYLKKEVRDGVHFLHADKNQIFYNLALSFFV